MIHFAQGAPATHHGRSDTRFRELQHACYERVGLQHLRFSAQEFCLASPGSRRFTDLLGAIYSDTQIAQPYIRGQTFSVNRLRYSSQKSYAGFARARRQFTPHDFLTGGIRYQHDDQGYRWLFRDVNTDAITATSAGNSRYGFFAGEVSLRHEFTSDVSVYATSSNSQTGPAYDLDNNAAAAREKVQNYEAGVRACCCPLKA